MTNLSLGLRHYLLILAPSLVEELEDFGLACAQVSADLDAHDVEQAFFAARGLAGWLPRNPEQVAPQRWPELMEAVHHIRRVLDVLEKDAFEAVATEARSVTARRARQDLRQAFEHKRAEGEVDFRLHGLSTTKPEPGGRDPAVQEAFRRKRAERYHLLLGFESGDMNAAEAVILADARGLARDVMEAGVSDSRIDALLAMAAVYVEMASMRRHAAVPEAIRATFGRMSTKAVMALGAIVYRDEYRRFRDTLGLAPLTSDL